MSTKQLDLWTSGFGLDYAERNPLGDEVLRRAVDEIVRVARRYVLCIEYFSHEPVAVPYRGLEGFLFKRDFGQYYLERFPSLRVLGYGFFWKPVDAGDNSNWWLFEKR